MIIASNGRLSREERVRIILADPRWEAVRRRDAAADGKFVFSVATTGVFCRPGCASRAPRPENVAFHEDAKAARAAGFRACKRCRPEADAPDAAMARRIAAACRLIEQSATIPTLARLARTAHLSAFHFHRQFKRITGLTPRAYATAAREGRLRQRLESGGSITEAIHEAGYGSQGRFYEKADAILGMTPRQYRGGGEQARIRFALGQCSLGAILVGMSERGVCAVSLGDDPAKLLREFQDRFPRAELVGDDARFQRKVAQVVARIESPDSRRAPLPLDVHGTAFQQRVWRALQRIPAGRTMTYAQIARQLRQPRAVRAVAGACAANQLAVLIPCHRVVRADGLPSGYRWGLARKRELLERESPAARGS